MTALGRWRATYAPGDWLVLCGPTSLVVVEPPGAGWTPLAEALWQEVVRSVSLVDLAGRLAAYGLDTMPSFGALFWTPTGMRSLVRGSVRLVDPASDRVVGSGEGVQTWAEVGLGHLTQVRLEAGERADARDGDTDVLLLPLIVGAVRASSVLLDTGTAAVPDSPQLDPGTLADAEQTEVDDVQPEPAHPAPAVVLDDDLPDTEPEVRAVAAPELTVSLRDLENADTRLMAPPPPRPPVPPPAVPGPVDADAPTVLAVVCPYGHPNPPGTGRCTDCGVRVSDPEPHPVTQPAVATLRVSDGTQAVLDRVVLVGRAPSERGDRASRLLTVPSPAHDISRTHLSVAPDGWGVVVTDLHSTNGTVLVAPDGVSRRTLPPGEPVPVALGSVLELAEGVSVLLDQPQ